MASLSEIKDWFKTGLRPTQIQFWATWDSFWHKDEIIPQSAIQNLSSTLTALSKEKRLNYVPYQYTETLQLDELIGMEVDAIAVYNQFITDGFEFDSYTGTIMWSFEEGVKHLIFYSKRELDS